jgi:hypothetical protein
MILEMVNLRVFVFDQGVALICNSGGEETLSSKVTPTQNWNVASWQQLDFEYLFFPHCDLVSQIPVVAVANSAAALRLFVIVQCLQHAILGSKKIIFSCLPNLFIVQG